MNDQRILRYFLGGNTCRGFHSLYDGFVSLSDGCFLWILKGGPGCGKSSFMKMIGDAAERKGLSVEYAVCSGDPSSLDGVYIPALKTAYTDGTAPHVTDPRMPGVDSANIDLGVFYDYKAIGEYKPELRELFRGCSACYKKAYAMIAAAGELRGDWQSGFSTPAEKEAAVRRAGGIAQREFGKRRREKGRITYRFLSALTCQGLCAFPETAKVLCNRFYVFENRLRMGGMTLQYLSQAAVDAGLDVIFCPDPLQPDTPEAVLIPALKLGFGSSSSPLADFSGARRIRLDALANSERIKMTRPELRRCEKMTDTLLNEAFSALSESNRLHERIEGILNPNVNFDGVNALARAHITALGLKQP